MIARTGTEPSLWSLLVAQRPCEAEAVVCEGQQAGGGPWQRTPFQTLPLSIKVFSLPTRWRPRPASCPAGPAITSQHSPAWYSGIAAQAWPLAHTGGSKLEPLTSAHLTSRHLPTSANPGLPLEFPPPSRFITLFPNQMHLILETCLETAEVPQPRNADFQDLLLTHQIGLCV